MSSEQIEHAIRMLEDTQEQVREPRAVVSIHHTAARIAAQLVVQNGVENTPTGPRNLAHLAVEISRYIHMRLDGREVMRGADMLDQVFVGDDGFLHSTDSEGIAPQRTWVGMLRALRRAAVNDTLEYRVVELENPESI